MLLKIATLKNKFDRFPLDQSLSYSEFQQLLSTFTICGKDDAAAVISGHFNGKERHTQNLHSKSLIILDIDSYTGSIADLAANLKRDLEQYKVISHSTASHTPENPRIRIILFLATRIETESYQQIAANFINRLSNSLKKAIDLTASTTPNKIFYLPIKPTEDYQEWFWENNGDLIEPAIYDFEAAASSEDPKDGLLITTKQQPLDNLTDEDIIKYLKNYRADTTDHDEWFSVGLALHHQYEGKLKGLKIWEAWSKADKRIKEDGERYYPGVDHLKSRWNSIPQNSHNPLTFATIIHRINYQATIKQNNIYKNYGEILAPISNKKWIDTYGKTNSPLFTNANFQVLLKEYNIEIKFDVIKKEQVIFFDGKKEFNINSALNRIKLLCTLNKLPYSLVNDTVNQIAFSNKFNSWKDWIESIEWDGVDRLPEFYDTIKVLPEHTEIREIYLRKWLLQMIHITCMNDGNKPKMARMVLTFQGKSSIGKTTWVAGLTPASMYDYGATGVILDTNKDFSIKKCIEHVIVELGELASTYRKSDIDALKNFISSHTDIIEIKYIARAEKYRRMTVFCATVNEMNFLQDQTGNTRFLCLPVLKCNGFHNIDLQQLYAQLLVYVKNNSDEDYNLTHDETTSQTQINNELESISPLEEALEAIFDLESNTRNKLYNATNILLQLGYVRPQITKKHTNEMARILDKLGFKRNSNPRGWYLPPKRINNDDEF